MARHGTHCRARKIACLIPLFLMTTVAANAQSPFHLIEATIDGIHAELRAGRLSCVQLVQAYLNRIKAYDQAGPALNAVQNVNSNALTQAAQLDAQRKVSGDDIGPLHCIPVLLKDQFDTSFMPTTYGSALFKAFVPERNATVVDRLQAASAIILAKTNMGEVAFAYSGFRLRRLPQRLRAESQPERLLVRNRRRHRGQFRRGGHRRGHRWLGPRPGRPQ